MADEFITPEFSAALTDVYMRACSLRWSLPDRFRTDSVVIDMGTVEVRSQYNTTIVQVSVTQAMKDDWYARQRLVAK